MKGWGDKWSVFGIKDGIGFVLLKDKIGQVDIGNGSAWILSKDHRSLPLMTTGCDRGRQVRVIGHVVVFMLISAVTRHGCLHMADTIKRKMFHRSPVGLIHAAEEEIMKTSSDGNSSY